MNLIPAAEREENNYSNNIATINKVNTRSMTKFTRSGKKQSSKWAENLKWEFMPGAVCPACGQNNHEIYKTGCPAMAVFCNCQKFFNKTDPEQLKPVLEQFTKFKAEQRQKQAQRRKNIKSTIKSLEGSESYAVVKRAFHDEYLLEFPEEQFVDDPLDQDDDSIESQN